jgi:hypothetical protein
MHDAGTDMLGLPETNLDWLRPEIRKQGEDIMNEFFGTHILATSTSKLRANTPYKPGGTCMGVANSMSGRYESSGSDPHGLGRWSYVQLHGKNGKSAVVITVYQVCDAHIGSAGASTAFHQQWYLSRMEGDLTPNPRKRFITDLTKEIKKWQKAGADILLGGDFNERLGDTQDGLAHLVTECNLVDIHATNHGTKTEPNTYSRGIKRVDYVFTSPRVVPFVDCCGIDPFHLLIHSDHRSLFMDVDFRGLLGGVPASILPPKLRGVSSKTNDPSLYVMAIQKHLIANNVYVNSVKIFAAARSSEGRVAFTQIKALNKIDATITRAMLLAELKCRRKPRAPWSDTLAAASSTVRFWKTLISGIQTNCNVSTILHIIGTSLQWTSIPDTTDMMEAKAGLKKATSDLARCRKEAKELRQTFLDDQIEAAATAEDSTKEKMLKKIRHREAQLACFSKLSYALKPPGAKGGVNRVEVKVNGHIVAYTEKNEVERETQKYTRSHFNQAAGTPFTVYPLSEVGTTETQFRTTHLPDGKPVQLPVDTFLETETIFDLLKQPLPGAAEADISSRISLADFVSAIKVWNEKTSTSPSGRHLGHYKLLVKTYEDKESKAELQEAAREILQLMVDIMDLASDRGFTLNRWTKVINVMIYKQIGVYLVHRLRVIHLFEADCNFIIGTILGRRAMYSGVDNKTLHPRQWAQPGRQYSDVVVLRELTLAIAKLTKTPLAGFENDASACYDRIGMNLVGQYSNAWVFLKGLFASRNKIFSE